MLLPSIFISVVVCTVEICEFLPVFPLFICTSRPLENLSPVSRDTCDNFSHFEASFFMPQTRGSCGHIKGTYDNHLSCINCCGCCRFHGSVCNAWSDATWDLVHRRRLYSDRSMGKKEAKEKKPRKSASRTSSSSRPGLERTESADQTGSAAEGPDDDFASALSRSSSGGERKRGSTQVSKHSSHGTLGPKSMSSSPATQSSTPARPLTRDLAGKYRDPATSQVILQGSKSAGSQNLSTDYSTLGTLLTTRSPRSESLPPVERPSSCDTGHNARLATKGSVQQSSVNRPANSEHAPVTPGPGKPGNGLSTGTGTGTRYPVLGSTEHTG